MTASLSEAMVVSVPIPHDDSLEHVVAPEFEAAVVGDMSTRLQGLVAEHNSWLSTNCQRQACLSL